MINHDSGNSGVVSEPLGRDSLDYRSSSEFAPFGFEGRSSTCGRLGSLQRAGWKLICLQPREQLDLLRASSNIVWRPLDRLKPTQGVPVHAIFFRGCEIFGARFLGGGRKDFFQEKFQVVFRALVTDDRARFLSEEASYYLNDYFGVVPTAPRLGVLTPGRGASDGYISLLRAGCIFKTLGF